VFRVNWRKFNIISRVRAWKNNILSAIIETQRENARLAERLQAQEAVVSTVGFESSRSASAIAELETRFQSRIAELEHAVRSAVTASAALQSGDGEIQKELGNRFLEMAVEQEIIRSDVATIVRQIGGQATAAHNPGVSPEEIARLEQGMLAREANRDRMIESIQVLLQQHNASIAHVDLQLQTLAEPKDDAAANALAAELQALRAEIASVKSDFSAVSRVLTQESAARLELAVLVELIETDVRNWIPANTSATSALTSRLEEVSNALAVDRAAQGALLSTLDGQAAMLDQLRLDVDRNHAVVQASSLAESQAELQAQLKAAEARLAEMAVRQDALGVADSGLVQTQSVLAEQLQTVDARLADLAAQQEGLIQASKDLAAQQEDLVQASKDLAQASGETSGEGANLFRAMAFTAGRNGELLARAPHLFINQRGNAAVIVASQVDDDVFQSGDIESIVAKLGAGELSRLFVTAHPPESGEPSLQSADELLPLFVEMPRLAKQLFRTRKEELPGTLAPDLYGPALQTLAINPFAVEAVASAHAVATGEAPIPYDKTESLPRPTFAQAKRRSALFLHNNYYHFNCLAEALRKRGWDAMTVSVESPDSPQRQFYHGEDLNLFDADYKAMREKIRAFLATVPERFGALHFYGSGQASFFPEYHESSAHPAKLPWDFFELRRHRMTIGYMPTGCMDGARQSDIRRITNGLCRHCVWERRPDVCSDARSMAWADRLEAVCDWIGLECDWAVGRRTGAKYVRGPVVTTLDSTAWAPGLRIPKDMFIPRQDGEVLIYHAVGNYESRRRAQRDIKGTGAVLAAIETLQKEGLPVRLIFFSDVASTRIKYYQAQADIVIDQLRYGRYGANARECMMLGLPVVGWIDGRQEDRDESHRSLEECPIVRANVDTIADALRPLVQDKRLRERIGAESRRFALRWHGDEACAERYEKVINRIQQGLPPDSPDLYPGVIATDAVANEKGDAASSVVRSPRVAAARVSSDRPPQDWPRGE
jgi:hypothetical protein